MMETVKIELTTGQAAAVSRMLDLATRIHLCQFGEIESLARMDGIKHYGGRNLTMDELEELRAALADASRIFGFASNASFGIYSLHVNKDAHRGYEVKKVLDKALAEWREPNPTGFRGVNYDGLICRATDDPAPVAIVVQHK